MTREQILEILENYKLRIPPTVFYDLKADIVNFEEPTTKDNLGVDLISRADAIRVASGYCHPSNVAKELAKLPSVTPQEPFINKPCVSEKTCEHDKNVVLNKIRAEIETKYGQCRICEFISDYDGVYTDIGDMADILQIIDKYKAETERT